MFNQLEYQTVVLAALLHDIGKFLQRGSFGKLDISGKHPQVSVNFISAFGEHFGKVTDLPLLKTLAQRHHESPQFPPELRVQNIKDPYARSLAYLVSKADNLSSAERGPGLEQWDDYKAVPLVSVFGRVNLSNGDGTKILRHHLAPFGDIKSLPGIFPAEFEYYSPNEMNKHLQSFGADFRSLFERIDTTSFECVCTHLLGLLQKYTWCIPSNTQEKIPDVSLYDHLKTTAAIAACLYKYHSDKGNLDERHIQKDEDRFYIVVGDLSGIQDYIFDIASTGAGGVAKRLRARSLFVQLIIEAVAHRLVRRLGLPLANIVMFSGGKFHCLLPNTGEATAAVDEIQQSVDQWLLEHLNGELALNISGFAFGDEGFTAKTKDGGGFGTVVGKSAEKLAYRKGRRFVEALTSPKGWREDAFTLKVHFKGQDACKSCGKFPRADDPELCSHCQLDRWVGGVLPSARYIAFFENENDGNVHLAGYSASLAKEVKELSKTPYLVLKLNDTDLAEIAGISALPKYVANHVALSPDCSTCESRNRCKDKNELSGLSDVATFGCLANRALGRPFLGFLKADADKMGQIFRFGLKREQTDSSQNVDTISRLSTLSRQLDVFFTGWMEYLAEKECPDCYAVFSGGDDLFFVGPWDKVIYLAEKAAQDFRKLTANPDFTISAGIVIAQSRYPVARAAAKVDDALKESKRKGRDRLTLLGTTLTWSEWAVVRDEWESLRRDLHKIPSAFIYSLVQYGHMWQQYRAGDTMGLRFQPLLAYNIARNLDPRQTLEICRWAEWLLKVHPDDAKQRVVLDHLGLIATLLILSRERGG